MSQEVEITICSGCITRGYQGSESMEQITRHVQTALEKQRPAMSWKFSSVTCFRFCPENRITIGVDQRMSMTRGATIEAIVNDILSFYPLKS